MAEFRMPSLGADMESATLAEWYVAPGDSFARGDLVASVETSKGIIDVEIFESGVVDQLLVEPGTEVEVGAVLATYRTEREITGSRAAPAPREPYGTEAADSAAPEPRAAAPPRAESAAEPRPAPGAPRAAPAERRRVSPAARRRAHELGVDLTGVLGTGPQGAVTVDDVERARTGAAQRPSEAARADMRDVIARSMSRSKREIPHYYLATTIDMTRALDWLEAWNTAHAVTERMLYGALLVKAVARALETVPELNGFWRDGGFEPATAVNVGVAIRLRNGGLVAPAIEAAGEKPLPEVMRALQELVQRARAGRLRRSELTSPTITVSSLGEDGVETVYPIIHPPQVAIVGFGAIVERPWCRDGVLTAASVVTATLSADHRVSDGYRGSRFLIDVDARLQRPEEL